ncbi:DUF4292 domain-containing protein [Spirosoma litoris]
MNKYLCVIGLLVTLLSSEGCRRRHMSHSTGSAVAPSPTPDSTTAARPTSTIPATTPTVVRPDIEEARTRVAEIDFQYLTTKSKLSFKSPSQDIDNANVSIRIQKDSLIWLSVSKLGIEAVRGLITPDSITIIDKIHKEYTVYDFPTLSKQFNFQMNFQLLQALIVGNLPFPKRPAQLIKNEGNELLLRQTEGQALVENYIGEQDRKLKKLVITEQPTKNTLRLDYEDFTTLTNFLVPYTSLLTLDYQSKTDGQSRQTQLRLKHTKVELVETSPGFPFTLPTNYERRP